MSDIPFLNPSILKQLDLPVPSLRINPTIIRTAKFKSAV